MKGYDAAAHVLACFGGAGGQHACAIATALGMKTIFVHRCVGECGVCGGGVQQPRCEGLRDLYERGGRGWWL